MYYTQLPKKLFYTTNEDKSLIKLTQDYKTLLVLDFLTINRTLKETCNCTMEHLIQNMGYSTKDKKSTIIKDIKNTITTLHINNYIEILNEDINNLTLKKYLIIDVKNLIEKNEDGDKINYFQLEDKEKEKIMSYKKEKIDNVKLLNYYCYLKSRMYYRDNMPIAGGKAQVCYPSFKTMEEDLNITDKTIDKYNNILEKELNLIGVAKIGTYYHIGDTNKILREGNNIYTLTSITNWEDELAEGVKQYKYHYKDSRVFTNSKKYKNNNKKVNGFVGRIEYLEEQGKATEKQIVKKNKLKEGLKVEEEVVIETKEIAPEEFIEEKYMEDDYDWFEEVEKSMQKKEKVKKEIMTEPPQVFSGFYAEVNKNRKVEEVF